jgi:hypothetical protein
MHRRRGGNSGSFSLLDVFPFTNFILYHYRLASKMDAIGGRRLESFDVDAAGRRVLKWLAWAHHRLFPPRRRTRTGLRRLSRNNLNGKIRRRFRVGVKSFHWPASDWVRASCYAASWPRCRGSSCSQKTIQERSELGLFAEECRSGTLRAANRAHAKISTIPGAITARLAARRQLS